MITVLGLPDNPAARSAKLCVLHASLYERLPMWVVYAHPCDYPQGYVARMFVTLPHNEPSNVAVTGATVAEVRAQLPPGLTCLARSDTDDPKIVETWL